MELQFCQRCGGDPVLDRLELVAEVRWRVRCPKCNRMTLHYHNSLLAVEDWNTIQNEARAPRALGEG